MNQQIPLLRPEQTEKAMTLSKVGKYLFLVRKNASKITLKQAFFALYHVMPKSVNILKNPTKKRLVGRGKVSIKRRMKKKAIFSLASGKTIDIYKVKEK